MSARDDFRAALATHGARRLFDAVMAGVQYEPDDVGVLEIVTTALADPDDTAIHDLVRMLIEWRNSVGGLECDEHRATIFPETVDLLREIGLTVEVVKPVKRLGRIFRGDRRVICWVRRPPELVAANRDDDGSVQ